MDIKYYKIDAAKSILHYNSFSCIYTTLVVVCSACFGCIYIIGDLHWYFPTTLLLGELVKSNFLHKNEMKTRHKRKDIWKNIGLIGLGLVIFDLLEVCAGAPFFERQDQTFALAVMLTIMTVIPCCLNIGYEETIEVFVNIANYEGNFVNQMIVRTVHYTIVGSWLGAVVIPLDWDRPWQVWPIPCCLGALAGNVFGNIMNIILPKINLHNVKKV